MVQAQCSIWYPGLEAGMENNLVLSFSRFFLYDIIVLLTGLSPANETMTSIWQMLVTCE